MVKFELVRIQSRNGTKRINTLPTESLQSFLEKVISTFDLGQTANFSLFCSPGHRNELTQAHLGYQLQQIPIKHGDMLYLADKSDSALESNTRQESESGSSSEEEVIEDEVDRLLATKDGRINRERDPQLCHHTGNSKCINCVPLEPWDKRVLESRDPPIKHLSFHCHIRKLTSGVDRGKFAYLEDLSCKIKPGCVDHPPWPAGICTKCQPSAVTLARQPFRQVDNVMFDDGAVVNKFIEGWRKSGQQRVGYLLGRYEEYTDVPLGIKAVVSAIYEPPQLSGPSSVELLEDPHDSDVVNLAALLGLRKVGWIFTDLESEGNGKVAYKRNVNTHLLSAEECIMAADFQNHYPSPCKLSKSSYFGSKFITVCVSGDENNQIDLKGYQMSNQCQALVRDDCLVPTLDAHELGYIRESTPDQYVPDVFFKTKDEYGGEVTKLARPLPLEYLIIELTTSTPRSPTPLLPGGRGSFPVENRDIQDFNTLSEYIRAQQGVNIMDYMSDFHLLYFLYTSDVLGLDFKTQLPDLCKAIHLGDRRMAEEWKQKDCWATVEQLVTASVHSPTGLTPAPMFTNASQPSAAGGSTAQAASGGQWACQHCTLLNPAHLDNCELCHLPRTN